MDIYDTISYDDLAQFPNLQVIAELCGMHHTRNIMRYFQGETISVPSENHCKHRMLYSRRPQGNPNCKDDVIRIAEEYQIRRRTAKRFLICNNKNKKN